MTNPQYVNNLAEIYTEMYNPSGRERPLTEDHNKDHDYDIPKWKRLLNQAAQKEKFHRGPRAAHREEPVSVEEEEHPNQDVGVGSDFMDKYLDGLEARNQSAGHQAQQYLETIIDNVPTAVGGVNIHSIIKDAFIAGTKAK
jgi:hypothetical protein